MADAPKQAQAAEGESAKELEGGSYDVIRKRLLDTAGQLSKKAEELNARRTKTFGGSQLALITTERVRTENNCVPRDIRQVHGNLLFGYNVFVGLRTETHVNDVFSVHKFVQNGEAFDVSQIEVGPDHFLADPTFLRDFSDLYRYNKDTKLLMIRTAETRLLAIFQVGTAVSDVKVLRWGLAKDGSIKYLDARGDEDNVLPRQHAFGWKPLGREDQVSGDHPHYNINDEVFVETLHGDLTVKVENNTRDGRGVWREPVDDTNQSLDDAEVAWAKVGVLILIKIKPYREEKYRYLVYNTRNQTVVRIDAIGQSCLELPEDQGIIFPGGYYLRTGDYKVFDGENEGMVFRRSFKAPNGEDVLYVYDRIVDGTYLLLPYNLIRKDVQNPVSCHGYCTFDDGKLVIFKSLSDEPTKVHPIQIWQTPFCTQEHAAAAPTDGSFLAKVGNAELVRGISEALTLARIATVENPTRQTYEDTITSCRRMIDAFYWLPNEETCNLSATVADLAKIAETIIDEFEKVAAIKKRSVEALDHANEAQGKIIDSVRVTDMGSVEEFMGALASLRKQRGSLISLREMRYMDLARVEVLEKQVVGAYDEISGKAVQFLLTPTALQPLVTRLSELVNRVGETQKATELKPIAEDTDKVGEGLTVLSDIINGLKIEDPTQRTTILEGISEAYSQLNRARATLATRKKELSAAEGRGEFAAQFKLFGQSIVSAVALSDTPEKCDETLSKLLLQLEELEGRFGEFDEFLGVLAEKREEVTDAIAAKRQALLDERQRRAQNITSAAERILQGIQRKARTLASQDELNTYFASDAMVMKLRDLSKQLFEIGATVKGDEIESRLKSARQDAIRALRDKTDLFEGGDNVIRLGKHRFNVNTQPVELALVPRRDDSLGRDVLFVHLTGTDFYERIDDAALEENRDLWDQQLASETNEVYRSEYLAYAILGAAERGEADLTVQKLSEAAAAGSPDAGPLLEIVRHFAQTRHDEGYERGVHDVDASLILDRVLALRGAAGLLRFDADARALACLWWASTADAERGVLNRRARSFAKLKERLGSVAAQLDLANEIEPGLKATAAEYRLPATDGQVRVAARYLVEELASDKPRFVGSPGATVLRDALMNELDRGNARRDFEDDLRSLEKHPAERLGLVESWLKALIGRNTELAAHASCTREAAVLVAVDKRIDREPSSALTGTTVTGILGQHPLVRERSIELRLDEWLAKLERFATERVPRFRQFRKTKLEILDREKKRLRLDEFSPKVLSSFVRNQLIDKVYLPLVGDNLAKQMGAAGEGKRTDQMGMLLLISPPGYGKTTLMEYVANRLGLIFMKINGPALGHEVTSIDPNDAPNATARQEVDKINLALEMGNNVMLYLDDIQHTNPELLQKFISLCDAQRRIEGVWKGKTRTYDMRGKRFCVVMAGNPYTESGEKFKIPDMLANRADTYNLGDILEGKGDLFALSYIENALTSNKVLSPLSGREPEDTFKLIKMAKGEQVALSELSYAYSAAEVSEIVEVLKRLFQIQRTLLRVNLEYIASASQDDNFRTEPPFKLQGSYRNMNKVTEKIVSAHTEEEVERIVDDHYAGESQTLTTGAEQNLLKLAELRSRQNDAQRTRWGEIKKGFVRVKMMGGKEDDPVARVTGTLAGIGEQLSSIDKALTLMANGDASRAVAAEIDELGQALGALASRELMVQVDRDPAIAELLARQLSTVESSLAPLVKAVADSLILASHGAQAASAEQAAASAEQAAALKVAASEAAQRVEQLSNAQAQLVAFTQQQAQAMAQARQVVEAQQGQLAQVHQAAQDAVGAARQVSADARQVMAHAQHTPAPGMMPQAGGMAPHPGMLQAPHAGAPGHGGAQTLVQRPDATPAENEAIARAQLAIAAARGQASAPGAPGVSPEVGAAVFRVEHRLGELTQLLRALQERIGQGVSTAHAAQAQAQAQAQHQQAARRQAQVQAAGPDSGGASSRFDAAVDLQSASNFYRWKANGDVVNEGGVFIATRRKLPNLSQAVLIRLTLPGGVELEARGVVEWTRPVGNQGPSGFGARFVDLPTYGRQLVDHFIARREPLLFEQA